VTKEGVFETHNTNVDFCSIQVSILFAARVH